MQAVYLTATEYRRWIEDPFVGERIISEQISLVVIEGPAGTLPTPGSLPFVACYVGDSIGGSGPAAVDIVVGQDSLDHLVETTTRNPIAATSLAVLLRSIDQLTMEAGLAAESAVYSLLQSGNEFATWRSDTEPVLSDDEPTVLLDRVDDVLEVALNRPLRHNAISRQLRDELCAALAVPVSDDTITEIRLTGRGQSFCSGGDLAEFGARPDPAGAHWTRLSQSPARLIHRLRGRMRAEIHGAALGGGIEMAAFAGRVVAHPETRLGLPEVHLGLIPGAGGTFSISRRIGRQRCAALALATESIDSQTALAWGLVDEVSP